MKVFSIVTGKEIHKDDSVVTPLKKKHEGFVDRVQQILQSRYQAKMKILTMGVVEEVSQPKVAHGSGNKLYIPIFNHKEYLGMVVVKGPDVYSKREDIEPLVCMVIEPYLYRQKREIESRME